MLIQRSNMHRDNFGTTNGSWKDGPVSQADKRELSWIDDYAGRSSTPPSGVSSSPSLRSSPSKRYSNNVFGGRVQDYSRVRSSQRGGNGSSMSRPETTTSFSQAAESFYEPPTPEDGSFPVTSTRNSQRYSSQLSPGQLSPSERPPSAAEYRSLKSLSPAALRRASLALEQVILEIEEEAAHHPGRSDRMFSNKAAEDQADDDEIVMPRSPRSGVREATTSFGQQAADLVILF